MHSIVSLISGRGSNLEAIFKTATAKSWDVRFTGVISNNPEAKGLDFARSQGISTQVLNHRDFASRDAFDEVFEALESEKAQDLFGIFHCFTGDFEQARRAIDLNMKSKLRPEHNLVRLFLSKLIFRARIQNLSGDKSFWGPRQQFPMPRAALILYQDCQSGADLVKRVSMRT